MSRSSPRLRVPRSRAAAAALLAALLAASCESGDDGSSSFLVRSTGVAASATKAPVVAGPWMVFFASEAFEPPMTDLNGDGDSVDEVAIAVRTGGTQQFVLRAALAAAIVGNEIYLVVDEAADGEYWNLDLDKVDLVLLHWNQSTDVISFVDHLFDDPLVPALLAVEDERLVYAAPAPGANPDESSLFRIEKADPLVPLAVPHVAGGGNVVARLLGEEDGLVFAALDETLSPGAPDLNGDADATDEHVLALLDATDTDGVLLNAGRALLDATAPLDAARTGSASNPDWLVAFLVDEAGQGGASLNDPGDFLPGPPILPPIACVGVTDADALDQVLHFVRFSELELAMGPPGSAAVNTGLAGTLRAIAVDGSQANDAFVATLSPEADAGCDLNADTDTSDLVVRWVAAATPVAPPVDTNHLHAVADVPGGANGLSHLGTRLVMVVDEAADSRDIDDSPNDHELVGFLDPTDGPSAAWTFEHPAANPGTGSSALGSFVGTSWMAAEASDDRLPMTYLEEAAGPTSAGLDLNVDFFCVSAAEPPPGVVVPKVPDDDTTDALPVWPDFAGSVLDFDGQGYAVSKINAGIVVAKGVVFYRVDENADGADGTNYNNDGDEFDQILFRNSATTCNTVAMATASSVQGPVVFTDGQSGAAFFAFELDATQDFNGDGDMNDVVVQYFTF